MRKVYFLMLGFVLMMSLAMAQITDILTVIESNSDGVAIHDGATYTVRGIVTTPNLHATNLSFYIQDSTGAIDVFTFTNAAWYTTKALAIGSDVTVTGVVDFYRGVVEIIPATVDDIVVNGTGTVPDPITITMDDLQDLTGDNQARFNMRGKLAKIYNAYSDGTVAWPSGTYANLKIAIGSASGTPTGVCYINGATDCDESPEPTWPKNITGIFNQYDTSSPYWQVFEISPRAMTDFETYTSINDWEMY